MKLKINKACDLSSISVLPPHSSLNLKFGDDVKRISKAGPTGRELSVFSKNQASQLRSQQSQQSFSQGVSSHGMFSQLSQNSLDGTLTNDQRFGSLERESSTRKNSCLPPIKYTQDGSQMQLSGPSTSLTRKWNSAAPDHRSGVVSEELEHRIGMIETSLSRFGIILDSVQSDIMQANKGTKEVLLEIERIRQKLLVTDNSQQLMNKVQEGIKASLAEGLKTISDQVGTNAYRESLQEISSLLSALPERVETFILKSQNELLKSFTTNEIQTMACSLKVPAQKNPTPSVLPPKAINYRAPAQEMPPRKSSVLRPKVRQATMAPKIEMGTWNSVKRERVTFADRDSNKGQKQKVVSPIELQREWRVIIESDEDNDGGFSCLLEEKETGN